MSPCRENNLSISKTNSFVEEVITTLNRRRNKIVRIHESGDFYSQEYIAKWYKVAINLPDHTFYAYTKRDDLFTKTMLAMKPKNLVLIYSLDGIKEGAGSVRVAKGFNKIAITHSTLNNCPAVTDKKVICMVNCTKCISNKRETIIFKKH